MSSSLSNPETVLFYRECPPPPEVRHLVLSFWEFAVRAGARKSPIMHEIFPDGCISLVYRRNDALNIRGFSVSELHPRSIVFPVFNGDIFWGARLSPAACAGLLGCDPAAVEIHQCRAEDGEFGILDTALLDQLAGMRHPGRMDRAVFRAAAEAWGRTAGMSIKRFSRRSR